MEFLEHPTRFIWTFRESRTAFDVPADRPQIDRRRAGRSTLAGKMTSLV